MEAIALPLKLSREGREGGEEEWGHGIHSCKPEEFFSHGWNTDQTQMETRDSPFTSEVNETAAHSPSPSVTIGVHPWLNYGF